ncbi:MAG: FHA domain-containing protein, partial [Bacteriovoracaceae bacterium]|nr:FHA domain-containing protein [Bacteriovoracaceae bacterium]
MELQKSKQKIFFVLRPIRGPGRGVSFGTGRKLLGSSESCEIVLPYPGISPIHAVIEIGEESFKIYDMNSATGVLINGQKILSGELKLNDSLSFGKNEFKFEKSQLRDDIPSVLSSDLPPIIGSDIPPGARQQNVLPGIPGTRREKRQIPKTPKLPAEPKVPTVEYPLTKDPNAAFSEYIFEDADQLYPIFKYDVQKSAVEIIIIHKEQIYTVDYLPLKNGMFNLVGNGAKKRDVEYPYLGKMEKCPFVEISEEDISIYPLSGYDCMILSDDIGSKEVKDPSSISLRHNDILRFAKQDIQIFVRRTETPPEVEPAPFFRRDQEFKKYLVLTFLFVFLFLGVTSIVTVDKELEDEKNPERIATVLYKKKMKIVVSPNRAIVRTPKKKPIPQKSPQQLKIKKTTKVAKTMPAKKQVRKKKTVVKPGRKKTKITKLPKKAKPRKGPKKIAKKVSPSRPADTRKRVSVPKRTAPRRSARVAKSKGHVDTYKAINFKSTISSVLAKGGATKSV